ncbi:unnamed protein product [Gongylonema pulchrum]|uniref:Uncharacterized protein n=1 Tax=Gongylonema pulchrum TaxID=637853 RepID=A0A183DG88_9BILA|nr:unnamed protein product [Gongylonema pulchrum]
MSLPKHLSKEPNLAKVRLVMEQLWRRIERIYDAKLQAMKEREEKEVEEMVARLRHEYKENLLIKQKQVRLLDPFIHSFIHPAHFPWSFCRFLLRESLLDQIKLVSCMRPSAIRLKRWKRD